MKIITPASSLSDREQEAVAYFWAMMWAVVVLNPGGQRGLRAMLVSFGLVKPKGHLALSPLGERVMRFVKSEERPLYPRKMVRK